MLDLGLLLKRTEKQGEFLIEDVCLIRINDEDYTEAEIIEGKEKGIYSIFSQDLKDEMCVFPQQEKILDTIEENLPIKEKINMLKEKLIGVEFFVDFESLEYGINLDEIDIKKISKEIKQLVLGQDKVVDRVISTVMHNQDLYESNLSDDEAMHERQVMLIYGGTGTGKTEIVKQVAQRINIPYVIEDATKFTDEAYKARNVSDMLLDLLRNCDGNQNLAERGILVIDEIDKKSSKGNDEVSTMAVQNSLLKVLDGSVIPIDVDHVGTIDFDTSFLTVIMCGAFEKLRKNVSTKRTIGFLQTETKERRITVDDFVNFGMAPEFMGRVTNIIKTNDLGYDDLKKILQKSSISPLVLKKKYLEMHNIKFYYDEEFLDSIVKKALDRKTGARGLKSAVSDAFDSLDYNLDFDIFAEEVKEIKFEKGKVRKIGAKK